MSWRLQISAISRTAAGGVTAPVGLFGVISTSILVRGVMRASISAFVVYAATSLDLSRHALAHETFLYAGPDHDAAYASSRAGAPAAFLATATQGQASAQRLSSS